MIRRLSPAPLPALLAALTLLAPAGAATTATAATAPAPPATAPVTTAATPAATAPPATAPVTTAATPAATAPPATAPVTTAATPAATAAPQSKPLPKLLDLGADKCIPCKMMMPILDDLEESLAGRLTVEFIDVWKHPDQAKPYGIKVIPTQIFLAPDGKELYRHTGFLPREEIFAKWKELGYRFDTPPAPATPDGPATPDSPNPSDPTS